MFETIKDFEEEKVSKETNIALTGEPTVSLSSSNVEYSYEIKN